MWSKFTYACDQMAKMWRSHDPSIFNESVELVTKLRKILTYYSQINIHENSWTVKWRSVGQSRNGGVWNYWSTAPSHHVIAFPPRTLSDPNICEFILTFQEIGLLIESLATGDCSHSQWPSLSPEVQKIQTFILFLEYCCWELLYWTFLQSLSRNHHMTY